MICIFIKFYYVINFEHIYLKIYVTDVEIIFSVDVKKKHFVTCNDV